MEDRIIKKIDYKVEEESIKDKGFDETYQNHLDNQKNMKAFSNLSQLLLQIKLLRAYKCGMTL